MALVNVTNVEVGRNPAGVTEPFQFEVVFECLERLEADLDWKLTYVGSSENKSLDQELDSVVMGPINRGALKFAFEASPPDFTKIPAEDVHGFTIILLTGAYRSEEFIRIGWYIHNDYVDPELQLDPPEVPQLDKMHRYILTDAPRVTRFKISWDNPRTAAAGSAESAVVEQDDTEAAIAESLRAAMSLGITCNNPSSSLGQLMQAASARLVGQQHVDGSTIDLNSITSKEVGGVVAQGSNANEFGSIYGGALHQNAPPAALNGVVMPNSCGADVVGGGGMMTWNHSGVTASAVGSVGVNGAATVGAGFAGPVTGVVGAGDVDMQ